MRTRIIDACIDAICQFARNYQKEDMPYSFIYEDDVKSELYADIKGVLKSKDLLMVKGIWTICGTKGHDPEKGSTRTISILHCEQVVWTLDSEKEKHQSHVDIAVWDPSAKDKDYKRKVCCAAIEIKQRCLAVVKGKRGKRKGEVIDGAELQARLDCEKLKELKDMPSGQLREAWALAIAVCTDTPPPTDEARPIGELRDHLLQYKNAPRAIVIYRKNWKDVSGD